MVGRSIEKPKLELDVGLDRARTLLGGFQLTQTKQHMRKLEPKAWKGQESIENFSMRKSNFPTAIKLSSRREDEAVCSFFLEG